MYTVKTTLSFKIQQGTLPKMQQESLKARNHPLPAPQDVPRSHSAGTEMAKLSPTWAPAFSTFELRKCNFCTSHGQIIPNTHELANAPQNCRDRISRSKGKFFTGFFPFANV
jgi:hypothetical protein